MARQIQFATMVAMASMISAPEFLLAQTLTPESDLMPPVDPPALVEGGQAVPLDTGSAEDVCLKLLSAQVPQH